MSKKWINPDMINGQLKRPRFISKNYKRNRNRFPSFVTWLKWGCDKRYSYDTFKQIS